MPPYKWKPFPEIKKCTEAFYSTQRNKVKCFLMPSHSAQPKGNSDQRYPDSVTVLIVSLYLLYLTRFKESHINQLSFLNRISS